MSATRIENQGIAIQCKRGVVALYIVFFIGLTCMGYYLLGENIFMAFCGLVTMTLCGLYTPLFIWILFDPRPQILIGPRGVCLRQYSETEIPWCDIERFYVSTHRTRLNIKIKRLAIHLTQKSIYPPGEGMFPLRSAILKLLTSMDRKFQIEDICIPGIFLRVPPENIIHFMEYYKSQEHDGHSLSDEVPFPVTVQRS